MEILTAGEVLRRRPAGEPAKAPMPETLVLDWTDYCNAKCFFCPREEYEKQIGGKGGFVPFAKLKMLENVLREVKFFRMSSGIGEPLLHPELKDILDWLYGINPSIKLQTVTNGTALTGARAAWFAGHLDWLSVSLNASHGEAHLRDMFPHLAKSSTDASRRWDLHVRHLTEFLAGLPEADRLRVRFQMVTHRYNVKDVVDFVRLVKSMGGSHAVFSNIMAHPTTVDWSLFWVKDQYNDAIDEASEVGTKLGVYVTGARFYTSIKTHIDLDKTCRDPIDVAYVSPSGMAAPCCYWSEQPFTVNIYDENGFESYWNDEVLQRLRRKRDFTSCQVCGLGRVFDETSFHFSPKLKKALIEAGKLSEINLDNDYPDAGLVRACVENRLDLPSIRRTLVALNVPVEIAGQIESRGLSALPALEQACWEAFKKADLPVRRGEVALADPLLGIGWGPPTHDAYNRISARPIGGAQEASLFVRVESGANYELRFTIHHAQPTDLEAKAQIEVNGRAVDTRLSYDPVGRTVLVGGVPDNVVQANGGRLWVRIVCGGATKAPATELSLMRFEVVSVPKIEPTTIPEPVGESSQKDEEQKNELVRLEQLVVQKDRLIGQQKRQLAELDRVLQELFGSRSWRITAPLRKLKSWLHR